MTSTLSTSSAVPRANDLHEVLHLFIHDLRAPISVAQGFLRLVREQRLPDEPSRERALEQTMDALGRLSRLCDQAGEFLALTSTETGPLGRSALSRVIDPLLSGLAARGFEVELRAADREATLPTSRQVANRMLLVVDWATRQGRVCCAGIEADGDWLAVLVGTAGRQAALRSQPPMPIDCRRRGLGLALPVACLDIGRHGGDVWTTASAGSPVGVGLPVQREAA
jgi:signal transduction histidine kinase